VEEREEATAQARRPRVARTGAAWSEWFAEHAQRVAARLARKEARKGQAVVIEELLDTRAFLFRYDFGAFWLGRPQVRSYPRPPRLTSLAPSRCWLSNEKYPVPRAQALLSPHTKLSAVLAPSPPLSLPRTAPIICS
jgi:hypothetical protein